LPFFPRYRPPTHLQPFPTRRSSDLRLEKIPPRDHQSGALPGHEEEALLRESRRSTAAQKPGSSPPEPYTLGSNAQMARITGTVKDRKSTRLNSSHGSISYAVFCLKK